MRRNAGGLRLRCRAAGLCRRYPAAAISQEREAGRDLTALGAGGSALPGKSLYVRWIREALRD
jgi:hypothetical protein